ncbi:MAG: sulfatase [Verrucomicrobiota bacterium]
MSATQAKRPNIVFAFGDDWGRYARAYAAVEGENSLSTHIDTPNFDRVAAEGVLFTNAFVTSPSCTPCRSSVLSGRYFWECGLGAILQGAVWDESIPTYPLLLEQAGYHIGYTYKVWGPGRPRNAPYGGERTQHQTRNWMACFSQTATSLIDECGGVEEAKRRVYEEVHESFDQFLEARPDDSPFCYWWGPTNTHRKWQQGSGKNLWGLNPDDLEGKLPAFLPDVPEVREDVCDYLGECMALDAGLGIILDKLERIGELDNTLVIVSGDHGIPGMPRGKCNLYDHGTEVPLAARWPGRIPANRVVDDFVNIMDLAPTFLEAAGETPPECMSARSLMPVLTSDKSGTVDPARNFVVTGRERHVASAREGNLPYPQRSIRTSEYLYIINFEPNRWPMGDPQGLDDPATAPPSYEDLREDTHVAYPDLDASPTKAWMVHHRAEETVAPLYELGFGKRPSEELYDLQNDPDLMRNIVEDPACAAVRDELRERLMRELRKHDDPRVVQSPCPFENPPFTNLTN